VLPFDEVFAVLGGHAPRLVRSARQPTPLIWEHEERDMDGELVAVYESWRRQDHGHLAFVKYSPYGWVLSVSGGSPRLPRRKVPVSTLMTAPSVLRAADVRQQRCDRAARWTP
jgi:hypothetical protein